MVTRSNWPELDFIGSKGTLRTLQLWSQVVGKVRLALTPWLNHSWQVPFYVTARGFGTSPIPSGIEVLEFEFDLIAHRLVARMSTGSERAFDLEGLSVAAFYQEFFGVLHELGVSVEIDPTPQEMADAIPFTVDREQAEYEPAIAHTYWRALLHVDRVLKLFRTSFLGKASPVHLFWGAFDLAVTRFSGRRAPLHSGMPGLVRVMQEAYSHEVSSAGFWPGTDAFPHPAFYSYAYPEPDGFKTAAMPSGAFYADSVGEFILSYETVRLAVDPDKKLLEFLHATYSAAASFGLWDRDALECEYGQMGHPRRIV